MKCEDMPDISVLMSVHDGGRWLRDSIDSVLNQSEDDFEFIIINDGSTDDTASILGSYNDERLVIVNQGNMGLTKSLNRGLSIAKGEFIARVDADDICMLDRFHKQKNFLIENPHVVLVGSNAILIDGNNDVIGHATYPVSSEKIVERLEKYQPVFPHSSIFFRKNIILSEGGYNPYFERGQDNELYLRLSEKHQLAGLDKFLVKLRVNKYSLSYSDDLQLKMGIAALICYYRRKKGLQDFSKSDNDEWLLFFKRVEEWVVRNKFDKKRVAKSKFRNCRTLIKQKKYFKALSVLLDCFKNDPMFLLYRDINLNVPKDFKQFLSNNNLV